MDWKYNVLTGLAGEGSEGQRYLAGSRRTDQSFLGETERRKFQVQGTSYMQKNTWEVG